MRLLECVPNVSEGQHPRVMTAIAAAIRGAGATLLDTSADRAHHRSVFTFVGPGDVMEAAVIALVREAIQSIDLRTHRGVHPRLGAVDVIPFVPLGATTMAEAIATARHVGAVVADRFALPVYLYGEAAERPERRRLEDIRRGGFEALPEKLRLPEWIPDFGPAAPHPTAGAVVIGARDFLIAYNINLATPRLDIARRIAATIRESSGGLPSVKALGLPLADRGITQVSMNLTDYRRTSMLTVFEDVRRLAAASGASIVESELIGLVPAEALPSDPERTLLLRHYRTIEGALAEAPPG